jgi:Flp pilus assembly protein TadD
MIHTALSRLAQIAFFTLVLSITSVTHATEVIPLNQIQKLVNFKQYAQALGQLNIYVSNNPHDIQGRFLLGITLSEVAQENSAIEVFTKLTEDFPEVPEPYNNLGVLHARQGNLEQARQALEMAIRANPSYAIAQENLGDIYARLASAQYHKAQALDSVNRPLAKKVQILDEVVATTHQRHIPQSVSPSSTSSVPF